MNLSKIHIYSKKLESRSALGDGQSGFETLAEQILEVGDVNEAMRNLVQEGFSGENDRPVGGLNDIANRSEKQKEGINDEEILKTLRKMKKQRLDSIEMYKKGSRADLIKVEEEEIKVIDSFLPAQLNEEETKKICKEVIESLKASSIKDMGKIMGALK